MCRTVLLIMRTFLDFVNQCIPGVSQFYLKDQLAIQDFVRKKVMFWSYHLYFLSTVPVVESEFSARTLLLWLPISHRNQHTLPVALRDKACLVSKQKYVF